MENQAQASIAAAPANRDTKEAGAIGARKRHEKTATPLTASLWMEVAL